MGKVSYIIPVHKFDESVEKLLPNALQSIKESKNKEYTVLMVGPSNVLSKIEPIVAKSKIKSNAKYIENSGETDFASQVNAAAMMCTTKYFCVVEYDDSIMEYWHDCMEEYAAANEASIYIPIEAYLKGSEMVSFGNEIAWSSSFANELGYIDMDCLDTYMGFNLTGAFIKTEDFISVGKLKPSLKMAAWYEFLLRMCHNGYKTFVVPKLGYAHTVERTGSYMDESSKTVSQEESKWLMSTAKQEYFFKEDRKKVFSPEVKKEESPE